MNRDQIAEVITATVNELLIRFTGRKIAATSDNDAIQAAADAIMALDGDARKAAYQDGWRDREEAFLSDAARIVPQPPGDSG